jgi:hypothetical protein
MAIHDVSFNIPQRSLGKADVKFSVKRNGAAFGTLAVSNGSIVWFQRDSKKYGIKIGWKRFDEMMEELDPKKYERR